MYLSVAFPPLIGGLALTFLYFHLVIMKFILKFYLMATSAKNDALKGLLRHLITAAVTFLSTWFGFTV